MLKSTLLLLLNPTWLKHIFVYLSMQSYPRHTLFCRKSPGRWLQAYAAWVGNSLLCSSKRQYKPSPESRARVCRTTGAYTAHKCRTETLATEQPAQSASADEKGKAINPLVRRPELSTFTHRVMNHECELSDAPADTLLCERCISD